MHTTLRRVGALTIAAVALAACDWGETGASVSVADTSATVQGKLYTDDPGSTVTWWFEYGTTPSLGSTTPEQSATHAGEGAYLPIEAHLTDLAEGTTYHYRTCVRNVRNGGLCGQPSTFTTTTGRDSVHSVGDLIDGDPALFAGVFVHASSNADGTGSTGSVAAWPGSQLAGVPDLGAVFCMDVEDDRATVGFLVTAPAPAVMILYIEDNGTAGDRWAVDQVGAAGPTCPGFSLAFLDRYGRTLETGDILLHDHP